MKRPSTQGFTLIELLIAVAMLASVIVALFSFITPAVKNLRTINVEAKKGREGPEILTLIRRDLASAYMDARMEEAFQATPESDGTELRFVTSRNSILFLNGAQSDLTEVGYRLKRNDNESTAGQLYTLYRREDWLMDDDPLRGGQWIPVADNILEFKCTFFRLPKGEGVDPLKLSELQLGVGDSEEKDEWLKDDRYLPYAAKVLIRLDIRDAEERKVEKFQADGVQAFVSLVRMPPFPRTLEKVDDRASLKLNAAAKSAKPKPGDPPVDTDNNSTPTTK